MHAGNVCLYVAGSEKKLDADFTVWSLSLLLQTTFKVALELVKGNNYFLL